jgi:hypothetical protein
MNEKCIISHGGQSYLLDVLSFSRTSNNINNNVNHSQYYLPTSFESEIIISFSYNNIFSYFLNAYNKIMYLITPNHQLYLIWN